MNVASTMVAANDSVKTQMEDTTVLVHTVKKYTQMEELVYRRMVVPGTMVDVSINVSHILRDGMPVSAIQVTDSTLMVDHAEGTTRVL